MNPLSLNIGQRYMYAANYGAIEVSYMGTFPAMPGGDWHDFEITDRYKKEVITLSASAIERGDLKSINQPKEISQPEAKEQTATPVLSMPDIKEIDVAFTKGGRSDTRNIKGTCIQNAVFHAYTYLYKAVHRGATNARIYITGRRIGINDIQAFTPASLLNYLVLNIK